MSKALRKRLSVLFMFLLCLQLAGVYGCTRKVEGNKWGIDRLVIVLMPGEDTPEVSEVRNVFDNALSERLGIPVEEYHATDYSAMVEAMRTGSAHVAQFGPFAYVHAVERSGAECMVVSANSEGQHGYYSQIITYKDSGIETIEDLRGRNFGFVDPESTSGNVVPCNEIMKALAKTDPDLTFDDLHVNGRFFASASFTGTHANSVQGVFRHDIDAAAVSSGTLTSQINQGLVDPDEIRIISQSPRIPSSPYAVQKDLPEDLKAEIKDFFLGWDNAKYWAAQGTSTQFVEVKDSEYDYIRELRDKFNLTD